MKSIEHGGNAKPGGKRKLILDTALKLFIENGYQETKVIDIANAAGIGKGTVYEYFSSKEALFAELLQLHVVDSYAHMERTAACDDTPCRDQLHRYILFDVEMAKRFGGGKNFIDRLWNDSSLFQHPDLKKAINQMIHHRFCALSSIVEKGIVKGEFKPVEPMAAVLSIMGAISAFISFRYGLLSENDCFMLDGAKAEKLPGDEELLLNLLLYGLKGDFGPSY